MRARTYRTLLELGGVLGFLLAVFAALEFYYSSLTKVCSFSSYFSCGAVANSGRTTILGVPDWAIGIAGFLAILVLAGLSSRYRRDDRITYLLFAVTSLGVAVAAYLLYVEVGQIHALCPVCASAYVCGVVAWVGSLGLTRRAYRRSHETTVSTAPDG